MMEEILLRDSSIFPTKEVLENALGDDIYKVFNEFIEIITDTDLGLTLEWRYYNDGKAWLSKGEFKWITNRGTDKVKPIFWLSIWNGFFKISFYFSVVSRSELLTLPISKETKNLIENAKPMGKTMKYISIVFDVNDAKYIDDLLVLSEFRKNNI